jgi:hypothetical protein
MPVRLLDGKNIVVEEQSLERAILKLELTATTQIALYPHVDGDEVHMRSMQDGSWGEVTKLTVESD